MIELKDLSFLRSGIAIIDDINLKLSTKEVTVLLGSNGSGKSSLMKLILGLIKPTSGEIYYDGIALRRLNFKERSQKIAYVMQQPKPYGSLLVFDYILMGSFSHLGSLHSPTLEQKQQLMMIAQQLQIESLLAKKLQNLSGGELQIVHFAKALQQKSPYLILDEPLSALDYQRQNQWRCYLREFLDKRELGALITLHDPNMAIKIAQRIILMDQGRLIADLHKRDATFMQNLLQALNSIFNHQITLVSTHQGDLILWQDHY